MIMRRNRSPNPTALTTTVVNTINIFAPIIILVLIRLVRVGEDRVETTLKTVREVNNVIEELKSQLKSGPEYVYARLEEGGVATKMPRAKYLEAR